MATVGGIAALGWLGLLALSGSASAFPGSAPSVGSALSPVVGSTVDTARPVPGTRGPVVAPVTGVHKPVAGVRKPVTGVLEPVTGGWLPVLPGAPTAPGAGAPSAPVTLIPVGAVPATGGLAPRAVAARPSFSPD